MQLISFFIFILIGISLGLLGSGGSILTVPALVYLFDVEIVQASTYSLFIVGITSLIGAFNYYRQGKIRYNSVLWFGLPSVLSVWISRYFLLPALPQNFILLKRFNFQLDQLLLLLFALLMIGAALSVFKEQRNKTASVSNTHFFSLIIQGLLLGIVTGLLGAGGGFLIIPVLLKYQQLDMKTAIGTSLFIISLNAFIGFMSSAQLFAIDFPLLALLSSLAVIGVFMGTYFSKKISSTKLKPAFAYLVLTVAIYILIKELI